MYSTKYPNIFKKIILKNQWLVIFLLDQLQWAEE
jgi:hypothetical protein